MRDTDGFSRGDIVEVDYGYGGEPWIGQISGFMWLGDRVIARVWDMVPGSRQKEVFTTKLTRVEGR